MAVPTPYYTVYAPDSDYGNSDFDVRNTFSNAISYELPGTSRGNALLHYATNGWAFDSLFRSNSADPINITTGLYTFGLVWNGAAIDQRPNVVPNQPFWIKSPGTAGGKVINAAAFSAPATTFTQGDLQRNTVRGFGVWQEDIALRREFPIHDSVSLLFRAEAFNVFNHPLFGDVGVNDGRNLVFAGDTVGANNAITSVVPNPYFGISSETLASSLGGGGADGGFSSLYQIGAPRSLQFALKLRF